MKKKFRSLVLAGGIALTGLTVQGIVAPAPAHAGVIDTYTDSAGNIIALMEDGTVIKCSADGCF